MVIEVAGGQKDTGKHSVPTQLPGWTEHISTVPTAPPPAYAVKADVKSGKRFKHKGGCFLFFLLFITLLSLTIYFGCMTTRYRQLANEYKAMCNRNDDVLDMTNEMEIEDFDQVMRCLRNNPRRHHKRPRKTNEMGYIFPPFGEDD